MVIAQKEQITLIIHNMSDNFPNISTDGGDMGFEIRDPNNSAQSNLPGESAMVGPGGKTKISPTQKDGESYNGTKGYGFMTNSPTMQSQGMAPDGDNSSGIPAAQPIPIMTFGDPMDTGLDFRDGQDRNTVTIQGGGKGDISGYDIRKPNPMGGQAFN